MSERSEEELSLLASKKIFAELALKHHGNNFQAALELFGGDGTKASRFFHRYANDPEVQQFKKEILEERGEESFLPKKVDFLKVIWKKMNNKRVEDKDFIKMAEVYGKARGFFPDSKVSVESHEHFHQSSITNRVMNVQCFGTDEEWEKAVLKNQTQLRLGQGE